jgi:hypothetical protein
MGLSISVLSFVWVAKAPGMGSGVVSGLVRKLRMFVIAVSRCGKLFHTIQM